MLVIFRTLDTVNDEWIEAQRTWQLRKSKKEYLECKSEAISSRVNSCASQPCEVVISRTEWESQKTYLSANYKHAKGYDSQSHFCVEREWNHKGFGKRESPYLGSRWLTQLAVPWVTAEPGGAQPQWRPADSHLPPSGSSATPPPRRLLHHSMRDTSTTLFCLLVAPPVFHIEIQLDV